MVAEDQLAGFGAGPRLRVVVEDPLHLGARKVRINHQPRPLGDHGLEPVVPNLLADVGGLPALPHDRPVQWLARGLRSHHNGGFALVGDADGAELPVGQRCLGDGRTDEPRG